jgi:hypothetical protein
MYQVDVKIVCGNHSAIMPKVETGTKEQCERFADEIIGAVTEYDEKWYYAEEAYVREQK